MAVILYGRNKLHGMKTKDGKTDNVKQSKRIKKQLHDNRLKQVDDTRDRLSRLLDNCIAKTKYQHRTHLARDMKRDPSTLSAVRPDRPKYTSHPLPSTWILPVVKQLELKGVAVQKFCVQAAVTYIAKDLLPIMDLIDEMDQEGTYGRKGFKKKLLTEIEALLDSPI